MASMKVAIVKKLAVAVKNNADKLPKLLIGILIAFVPIIALFIMGVTVISMPLVFIGGDALVSESSTLTMNDVLDYYQNAVVFLANDNDAYVDSLKTKYSWGTHEDDTLILTDNTYVLSEMLIAIDTARYQQDYSSVTQDTVYDLASSFLIRDYTYTEEKKEEVSISKTKLVNSDGTAIMTGSSDTEVVGGSSAVSVEMTLEEFLEAQYPEGWVSIENGVRYFNRKIVDKITIKHLEITIDSYSLDEMYGLLGFEDDCISLANSYYANMLQLYADYTGSYGNYVVTDADALFKLPIVFTDSDGDDVGKYVAVTSPYGNRIHPTTGVSSFHSGVDLGIPTGVKITSAMDGIVEIIDYGTTNYGYYVKVAHDDNYSTIYAHLSVILVAEGKEVTTDTVIGLSGNTGRSTGPHLHFEIRKNDSAVDPVPLMNIIEE